MFPMPPPPDIVNNNVMPTTGWGSPVIWSSVLVAIIALIGVVVTNIVSGRNMFKAEAQRAEAAIASEEKRAEAALEAERLRHEHALDQRKIERQQDAKAATYANLVLACQEAMNCFSTLVMDLRSIQEGPFVEGRLQGVLDGIASANESLSRAFSNVQILGHTMVVAVAGEWQHEVHQIVMHAMGDPDRRLADEDEQVHNLALLDVIGDVDARLITLIRQDMLGLLPPEEFGDPVPNESAKDDGAPADLPEPALDTPDPSLVVPAVVSEVVDLPLDVRMSSRVSVTRA